MSGKKIRFSSHRFVNICIRFLSAILLGRLEDFAERPYPHLDLADPIAMQFSTTHTITFVLEISMGTIQQHMYRLWLSL